MQTGVGRPDLGTELPGTVRAYKGLLESIWGLVGGLAPFCLGSLALQEYGPSVWALVGIFKGHYVRLPDQESILTAPMSHGANYWQQPYMHSYHRHSPNPNKNLAHMGYSSYG